MAKKQEERYCLRKDDDSHWYLIPLKMKEKFNKLCDIAYSSDDFTNFEKTFGKYRINGYHNISFTNPIIGE